MKKIILALIMSGSFALQGCDDTAVAVGAGAVIGAVVGAAVIGGGSRCHESRETQCSNYRDRRGRWHRQCQEVVNRCGRRNSMVEENTMAAQPAMALFTGFSDVNAAPEASPEVAFVATHYRMSFESAQKVWSALQLAEAGNPAELKALGLQSSDFELLSQGQGISEESLAVFSHNVDMNIAEAGTMMAELSQNIVEARTSTAVNE